MAIQVSGTEVISNSRVLSNVTGLKTVGGTAVLGSGDIAVGGSTALGAVGTWGMLGAAGGSFSVSYSSGATIAGSALKYVLPNMNTAGSTQSGTWRLMTGGMSGFTPSHQYSLWVRIS